MAEIFKTHFASKPPDRLLRLLAGGASVVYFGTCLAGVCVLLGLPTVKMVAPEQTRLYWGMPVPVRLAGADAVVATNWGSASLRVDSAEGSLRLPISDLPWSVVGALWAYAFLWVGLVALFFHQLRRIFQRARDGAPFAPANAHGIWWLGVLLISLVLVQAVVEFAAVAVVRDGLADAGFTVPVGLHMNGGIILVGLVLLALSRVFHRGAELEREQALVV